MAALLELLLRPEVLVVECVGGLVLLGELQVAQDVLVQLPLRQPVRPRLVVAHPLEVLRRLLVLVPPVLVQHAVVHHVADDASHEAEASVVLAGLAVLQRPRRPRVGLRRQQPKLHHAVHVREQRRVDAGGAQAHVLTAAALPRHREDALEQVEVEGGVGDAATEAQDAGHLQDEVLRVAQAVDERGHDALHGVGQRQHVQMRHVQLRHLQGLRRVHDLGASAHGPRAIRGDGIGVFAFLLLVRGPWGGAHSTCYPRAPACAGIARRRGTNRRRRRRRRWRVLLCGLERHDADLDEGVDELLGVAGIAAGHGVDDARQPARHRLQAQLVGDEHVQVRPMERLHLPVLRGQHAQEPEVRRRHGAEVWLELDHVQRLGDGEEEARYAGVAIQHVREGLHQLPIPVAGPLQLVQHDHHRHVARVQPHELQQNAVLLCRLRHRRVVFEQPTITDGVCQLHHLRPVVHREAIREVHRQLVHHLAPQEAPHRLLERLRHGVHDAAAVHGPRAARAVAGRVCVARVVRQRALHRPVRAVAPPQFAAKHGLHRDPRRRRLRNGRVRHVAAAPLEPPPHEAAPLARPRLDHGVVVLAVGELGQVLPPQERPRAAKRRHAGPGHGGEAPEVLAAGLPAGRERRREHERGVPRQPPVQRQRQVAP